MTDSDLRKRIEGHLNNMRSLDGEYIREAASSIMVDISAYENDETESAAGVVRTTIYGRLLHEYRKELESYFDLKTAKKIATNPVLNDNFGILINVWAYRLNMFESILKPFGLLPEAAKIKDEIRKQHREDFNG